MSPWRRTIGDRLALLFRTMNPITLHHFCKRKAVWGPKRTALALFLIAACLAPSTAAAKDLSNGANKTPGVKSKSVKEYKLDGELTQRADGRNPLSTTRVIVRLQPGVSLPAEFKKFARDGKLDLINGQVLELPNGMLKKLADNSDVFRVHYD